jgi:hypothetical protein
MSSDGNKTLIPNTYQKPNIYSDLYDYYLTPKESKALDFIVRQILGWDEHRATLRDRISLSQICEGIQRKDGTWQSRGTGLSRTDAVAAIKALTRFNFIKPIGPATKAGQEYELNRGQLGEIDLAGLEVRKEAEHAKGMERTATARAKRASGQSDIPAVSQSNQSDAVVSLSNHLRLVSLTDSGQSIKPALVRQTDSPKPSLNPSKPNETQEVAANAAPPSADEPVDEIRQPSKPKPKPSPPSKPKADAPKEPTAQQEMVGALADVTGMDTRLNGSRLGKVAAQLSRVGATPDDLRANYGPGAWWYRADWRGQKGEFPRPEQVLETWGQWARAAPQVNGHARAAPTSKTDRNRALLDQAMRETMGDELPPGVIDMPPRRSSGY